MWGKFGEMLRNKLAEQPDGLEKLRQAMLEKHGPEGMRKLEDILGIFGEPREIKLEPYRKTYALLMFGPHHGSQMELNGPPPPEIYMMEDVNVSWGEARDMKMEALSALRPQRHTYRLEDEFESANMEEAALYFHHEKCCNKTMPSAKKQEPNPPRVRRASDIHIW